MKGEGGEPSVETVWCNLPPNYVQVEIFTAKATFNAEGEIATIEGGPLTPEFAARFPFAVYGSLQGCSEDPDKPGAHDEWMDANVRKDFKDLLGKAKLPTDLRLHDLRHTCATLLMVQGTPARVVMETLGHSQISLTLDTYSHVSAELQAQAADAMDALVQSA